MKSSRKLASVAILGLTVAACDEMPSRTGAARPSAASSVAAAPDAAAVERAALAYVEAARAHAKTCICYSSPWEGLIRDYCAGAGPELEAVKRAGTAIAALDAENRDVPPAAAAFLSEAALHARWLADYAEKAERWAKTDPRGRDSVYDPGIQERPGTIRGAVPAFQTLARRYNDWHPNAKVPAIAYGAYRPGGVTTGGHTLERAVLRYFSSSKADFEKRKRETEYLPWIECFDGPCMQGY
ncbi:MAG TPA: hypothetical protein VFZ53_08835 [Polyangiaceae bacterium]